MANGLLEMQSRPYRTNNLFDIPVDEGTRGMLLPFGRRQGEFSFAVPEFILAGIESAKLPGQAIRGDLGAPSLLNPKFTEGAQQFAVDFGLLPALGTAAIATPSASTLRMGAGGVDTASGGVRRGPDVDELGFYSQALEAAKNLQQPKGTGQQFRKMLENAGVKPDEIRFTPGLEGLLSQSKVTREELVGLLEESRIRPQETIKTAVEGSSEQLRIDRTPSLMDPDNLDDYVLNEASQILDNMRSYPDDFLYDEDIVDIMVRDGMERPEAERVVSIYKKEGPRSDNLYGVDVQYVEDAASDLVRTRYAETPDYQVYQYEDLDGIGYTVQEDAMGFNVFDPQGRMINTDQISSIDEAEVVAMADARQAGLISSTGDTRFMRFKEGGGTNYRETLLQVPNFEGQTDFFVKPEHFNEPNIVVHTRTTDRNSDTGVNDVLYAEEVQSDWGQEGRQIGFKGSKAVEESIAKFTKQAEEAKPLMQKYTVQIKDYLKNHFGEGVEYTYNDIQDLRRADGKFSAMYENKRDAEGRYEQAMRELGRLNSAPELAPFVGNTSKFAETAVKRLIFQAAKEGKRYVSFSPAEVQVDRWGEEGLETFYEKILPKAVKKVAKRLDKNASVDYMPIEGVDDLGGNFGTNRLTIEITPEMREQALKGQPLFTAPVAPAPTSGLLGEEQMTGDEMLRAGII